MTQGLVERHRPDVPLPEAKALYVAQGKDGNYYPRYEPLQAVLAVPLYVFGKTPLGRYAPRVGRLHMKSGVR